MFYELSNNEQNINKITPLVFIVGYLPAFLSETMFSLGRVGKYPTIKIHSISL